MGVEPPCPVDWDILDWDIQLPGSTTSSQPLGFGFAKPDPIRLPRVWEVLGPLHQCICNLNLIAPIQLVCPAQQATLTIKASSEDQAIKLFLNKASSEDQASKLFFNKNIFRAYACKTSI